MPKALETQSTSTTTKPTRVPERRKMASTLQPVDCKEGQVIKEERKHVFKFQYYILVMAVVTYFQLMLTNVKYDCGEKERLFPNYDILGRY